MLYRWHTSRSNCSKLAASALAEARGPPTLAKKDMIGRVPATRHPRNVVKHLVGADGGQEVEGLDLHSSERHIDGVLHSQLEEDAALLHDAFAAGHLL